MKDLTKSCLLLSAIIGMMAANDIQGATIYNVNDWYATASNATDISNGGTTSATINYGNTATATNAASTSLWSYFAPNGSPVQLLDGDKLTFSAGIAVNFASASSRAVVWRFGIMDSTSPRASTDGAGGTVSYGTDRLGTGQTETDVRNGWTGALTDTVTSGSTGVIYRRNEVNASAWSSLGGTPPSATSTAMTTSAITQSFTSDVPISLSLNITRIGNDLLLDGTLGSSTFSGTYVDYFAGGYPATFDTVGLFLGSQGTGSAATSSITISNAIVSVIPEPSTYALILGAFGMVLLLRRRVVRG